MYGTLEEPLFLAKDVAEWIEHSNTSSMLNSIDEDEKLTLNITYSEENGNILGISANEVGRIAKEFNLKTEQYGKWFMDKSPYSAKQVESFRYNDCAVEFIRSKLSE